MERAAGSAMAGWRQPWRLPRPLTRASPGTCTLLQLAVFYVLIAVGFLALYLTWRSNAK